MLQQRKKLKIQKYNLALLHQRHSLPLVNAKRSKEGRKQERGCSLLGCLFGESEFFYLLHCCASYHHHYYYSSSSSSSTSASIYPFQSVFGVSLVIIIIINNLSADVVFPYAMNAPSIRHTHMQGLCFLHPPHKIQTPTDRFLL